MAFHHYDGDPAQGPAIAAHGSFELGTRIANRASPMRPSSASSRDPWSEPAAAPRVQSADVYVGCQRFMDHCGADYPASSSARAAAMISCS